MTYLFNDKGDVALFFALVLMYFTDFFCGVIQLNIYRETKNNKWYSTISEKIIGMPPRWVFPVVWTFFFITIPLSLYVYYRNEGFPNNGYMIDTITLLFLASTLLVKTWTFVFFSARKTVIALVMIILIFVINFIMGVLFALHEEIFAAVIHFLLTIWCLVALYLNATWLYIEKNLLLEIV